MISEIQRNAFLASQVQINDQIITHRAGVFIKATVMNTCETDSGRSAEIRFDDGEMAVICISHRRWSFTGHSKIRVDAVLRDIANNGIENVGR